MNFVARDTATGSKAVKQMATRYTGSLKLSITLDSTDTYSVTLSGLAGTNYFGRLRGLGLSPHMASKVALDSAEAYDAIAKAAVTFAGAEKGADVYAHADCDDGGGAIIRRKKR